MPRKPNYRHERSERDRAKAAKIARKASTKAEQREGAVVEPDPTPQD